MEYNIIFMYNKQMLAYLIERENEEMLRTLARTLSLPDGQLCRIEVYRIVWLWFDRLVAYEFAPSELEILALAVKCSEEENLSLGDALGCVIDYLVQTWEQSSLDITDDALEALAARKALTEFSKRRKSQ